MKGERRIRREEVAMDEAETLRRRQKRGQDKDKRGKKKDQ